MIGMNPEPDPDDTYKYGNPDKTQIIWHQALTGIDFWVPVTEPPQPMNSDYARISQWDAEGKITIAEPDPPPPAPEPFA